MKETYIQCWNAIVAQLPYKAREVRPAPGLILVLIDADDYLGSAEYRTKRKAGMPALRNLWAFNWDGQKVWEAELPEANDYYYEIVALTPITARCFSSHTCELSVTDGRILSKTFSK